MEAERTEKGGSQEGGERRRGRTGVGGGEDRGGRKMEEGEDEGEGTEKAGTEEEQGRGPAQRRGTEAQSLEDSRPSLGRLGARTGVTGQHVVPAVVQGHVPTCCGQGFGARSAGGSSAGSSRQWCAGNSVSSGSEPRATPSATPSAIPSSREAAASKRRVARSRTKPPPRAGPAPAPPSAAWRSGRPGGARGGAV